MIIEALIQCHSILLYSFYETVFLALGKDGLRISPSLVYYLADECLQTYFGILQNTLCAYLVRMVLISSVDSKYSL